MYPQSGDCRNSSIKLVMQISSKRLGGMLSSLLKLRKAYFLTIFLSLPMFSFCQNDERSRIELPVPPLVIAQVDEGKSVQLTVENAQADQGKIYFFNSANAIVFEEEMELNALTSYYTISKDKLGVGVYSVLIVSTQDAFQTSITITP